MASRRGTGLDAASGLLRKLTDVADAIVDRLGPDTEEGGDGDLRQGEALVQDDGQELVARVSADGSRKPGR